MAYLAVVMFSRRPGACAAQRYPPQEERVNYNTWQTDGGRDHLNAAAERGSENKAPTPPESSFTTTQDLYWKSRSSAHSGVKSPAPPRRDRRVEG
ncbi:hypothetical protein GJAV_G00090420 [Gymnothorax javanicus]|nr:hypothetical protein GJAV_G00090420 [Gymnothorax javanicus]